MVFYLRRFERATVPSLIFYTKNPGANWQIGIAWGYSKI